MACIVRKKHWKERAQDELMHALAGAILHCEEAGEQDEKIAAMRKEAQRIMRFLGYQSWPGLTPEGTLS